MAIEYELTLSDYLSIYKRRWKQVLVVFFLSMLAITIVSLLLPEVYRAEGIIAVEAPSVSNDIVEQTEVVNYVDERIDKVKQKVLSRESLVQLNEKYNLFPQLSRPKKIAGAISKKISIVKQTRDTSTKAWAKEKITVALVVGFENSKPDVAYKVTNELISMFLDENVKARTKRVTETTNFLNEELQRMQSELEAVENKVATYKQKHSKSLPEHQEMHMGALDRMDSEIKTIEQDYKNTQEELRYLDVELTTREAAASNSTAPDKISELDKAKAELNRALVLYKETHPTVRALKRKVKTLTAVPEELEPVKINVAEELAAAKIKNQINAARVRLDSLASQKKRLSSKMAGVRRQIIKIPEVEQGLFTLLRDYENAKNKYEDVKAKQINAKIAENLERDDKAERFVLKESPEFPEYRESPVRTKIVGLGTLVSLGLGALFAFMLEMLDKRVRNLTNISSIIKMKPLAVIPHLPTASELRKKQNVIRTLWVLAIILVGLLLLVASIHFYIMPIGELIK